MLSIQKLLHQQIIQGLGLSTRPAILTTRIAAVMQGHQIIHRILIRKRSAGVIAIAIHQGQSLTGRTIIIHHNRQGHILHPAIAVLVAAVLQLEAVVEVVEDQWVAVLEDKSSF